MDLRMESQSRPLRLLEEKLTAPNSLTGLEVIGTHLASLNQSFVLPTLSFFFFFFPKNCIVFPLASCKDKLQCGAREQNLE